MPDRRHFRTTWDGLFISEEPPFGVTVIVMRRATPADQYLVLHRAQPRGEDWAWGPPAGIRLPGEDVEACARRSLEEATGLALHLHAGSDDPMWASYWAIAPAGAEIALAAEYDRYDWVSLADALDRCRPAAVAEQFAALARVTAA